MDQLEGNIQEIISQLIKLDNAQGFDNNSEFIKCIMDFAVAEDEDKEYFLKLQQEYLVRIVYNNLLALKGAYEKKILDSNSESIARQLKINFNQEIDKQIEEIGVCKEINLKEFEIEIKDLKYRL